MSSASHNQPAPDAAPPPAAAPVDQSDQSSRPAAAAPRARRGASRTAIGIAAARALERERPPDQRIVDDPFARHFVGEGLFRLLKFFDNRGWSERKGPGVMGYLVARERYIDDLLLRVVAEGIDQLVILGAGFDARAYRFARRLIGVRVFEVDLPATQEVKRAKAEHFLDEVELDLRWVPMDFETDDLAAALHGAGYDPLARTLFIWQGVVMYLTPPAVDATLRLLRAQSGPGSAVIFDYMTADRVAGRGYGEVKTTNRYGRLTGERLQMGIDPEQAVAWLEARGFVQVENMRSEQLHARYFGGANAHRTVTAGYGILIGRVPAAGQR
ncbi:MAG: SAM-dependent methyltransferase [Caldilineaceae bacterium]